MTKSDISTETNEDKNAIHLRRGTKQNSKLQSEDDDKTRDRGHRSLHFVVAPFSIFLEVVVPEIRREGKGSPGTRSGTWIGTVTRRIRDDRIWQFPAHGPPFLSLLSLPHELSFVGIFSFLSAYLTSLHPLFNIRSFPYQLILIFIDTEYGL